MKVLKPGPDAEQAPAEDQRQPDQRQEAEQRADQRRVAHERGVTGTEQHAVEREDDSGDRQLRHHEPPRHPDRVEHRTVVGEQRRQHRGARPRTRPPAPPRRSSRRSVTRHATDLACASPTRAERGTHQRLRRDGQRIQHQRKEIPQLQHHLVGGDGGGAEPGGHRTRRDEAGLKGQRAQHQIAAHHHLRAQHRGSSRSGTRSDQQRSAEQHRGQPLPDQVGHRRTGQPQPRHTQPAVHQQRAQHRRHTRTRQTRSAAAAWCPARRASSRCRPPRSGSPAHRGSRSAATAAPRAAMLAAVPAITDTSGTAADLHHRDDQQRRARPPARWPARPRRPPRARSPAP